jgi:Ca2+-binding EF-hand superfamily protein
VTEEQLHTAIDRLFEEYDKDKSGALDKHEVIQLMTKSLGRSNLSDKEVDDFIMKMDVDGSKTIDKKELFRIYKQLYC